MTYYLSIRQTFSVAGPDLPASYRVEPHDGMTVVGLLVAVEAHTLPDAFGVAVAAFTSALAGWTESVDGVSAEDVTEETRAAGGLYDGLTGEEVVKQFEDWFAGGPD